MLFAISRSDHFTALTSSSKRFTEQKGKSIRPATAVICYSAKILETASSAVSSAQ